MVERMDEPLRICVVGAGALGCYFGSRLTLAGHRVAMIARGPALDAISREGITTAAADASDVAFPAQVTSDPAEVGPVDAVLLTVKAWQVPEAAQGIRPLLSPSTRVLPLQNGVEAMDQLISVLGEGHPLGGLSRIVCVLEAPGRVRHVALRPTVALGEPRGGLLSQSAQRIAEALERASVAVERPASIRASLWEKLVLIAAVSGVGAATRVPVGEMWNCSESRALLVRLMEEAAAVAGARGVELADGVVARTLAFVEAMPPHSTTSMQRDVVEGRPSEVEAIIGALTRYGRESGVPTPVADAIYGSLLPQEIRARRSCES